LVIQEYLEALHELHEDWLVRKKREFPCAPVLILDADKGEIGRSGGAYSPPALLDNTPGLGIAHLA